MISQIKRFFYFPIAYYFSFFAQIQLLLWKPRIIVITGSTGKTTLLHLIESQLGNQAVYSHHANSSFGIPFNILGLERKDLTISEWPALILGAPIKAFQKLHTQKLYVVEADCDRPNEGKFLAELLKPVVTVWLSVSKTHTLNFAPPVEENVAKEFGYFLEHTREYALVNGDSELIVNQILRTKSQIKKITKKQLQNYQVQKNNTVFKINDTTFRFNYLLPEDTFYNIAATNELLKYLTLPFNANFKKLVLPPSRSTILKGIKNTTIIDSSYNTVPASVAAILKMYQQYPAQSKWAILGDMIELGSQEQVEHEKLAALIANANLTKVLLVGPRVTKYTYPKLKSLTNPSFETFITPKEALDYLKNNLKGGEVLLFKGARFLEGVIEHLLQNKSDVSLLCRREKVWQERRRKWGL